MHGWLASYRHRRGVTLRHQRRAGHRSVECLEERQLLATGTSSFAHFSGNVTTPGIGKTIALQIDSSQFTLTHGRVILGFSMQQADESSSGHIELHSQKHTLARQLLRNDNPVGDRTSLMLARMSRGGVDLRLGADSGALGSFEIDAFLAGDANGDYRVDRSDLALIRSLRGTNELDSRFVIPADADGDGTITLRDLAIARLNLGASTEVRPMTVSLALDPDSDPDGNGVVTRSLATVDGRSEPGALVSIDQDIDGTIDQATEADSSGNFHFDMVVPVGNTPVQVVTTDQFGQKEVSDFSVRRGDVVLAWNQTTIDAIRNDRITLGLTTRTFAMVHAAIYDAVNDIERQYSVFKVDVSAPADALPEAAAAEAAYTVLVAIYPDQKELFDATLAESLNAITDGSGKIHGIAVGEQVAQGILAWRADDGSDVIVPYTAGDEPGQWRPTPPDFSAPWGPEWSQVATFAIPSALPFLPPPPPPLNSPEYTAAFNEAKSIGVLNSTTRRPFQTETGIFWGYDTTGKGPPPVMYNQTAQTIALQQGNTLEQNARLFALANIAMADVGIVAWDSKFTDNFWRPVTAIPLADTDGNPDTVADPAWEPLGAPGDGVVPNFTPPFPAYVSGHASFGAALFQTLADFYGTDNIHFTIGSDELPGVYHSFDSFSAAAEENGQSRIYLGIHWQFDKTNGIALGEAVGNYVFEHQLTRVSP
jgi:Dockerin type I domain